MCVCITYYGCCLTSDSRKINKESGRIFISAWSLEVSTTDNCDVEFINIETLEASARKPQIHKLPYYIQTDRRVRVAPRAAGTHAGRHRSSPAAKAA